MIRNWLKPDWETGLGIANLPIDRFINLGIKALILDVDGTLLPRQEKKLHSSVILWIQEAKLHLDLHLLSNNPSKKRIEYISKQININFTHNAAKPSSRALRKALISLQQDPKHIAIIGDRIFTDILVGNRLGLYTVLVQPIGSNGKTSKNNTVQRLEQSIAAIFGAIK